MALQHSSSIVTRGLVFCIDAGNPRSYIGSGTAVKDISGNDNTGTLLNGVGYSADNLGSFVYDGVDDSMTFSNSNNIAITGDMSILAWVNITNFTTYRGIVAKTVTSSIPAPYDFYTQLGSGKLTLLRGNGTAYTTVTSTAAPATGVWQHIAVTMIGTSVVHYLNATANGTGTLSTTIGNDATQPLYVGYRVDGTTKMLGNYGSLQIYNIGLTATQILQNFNAQRGRYGI
jgi:hypothetical protein